MKKFSKFVLAIGFLTSVCWTASAAELKEHNLRGFPKNLDGGKNYDADTLTPDQLKICLQTSRKMDLLSNILNSQSDGFNASIANLNTLAQNIELSQAYLDSHPTAEVNDEDAMAERNKKVRAHNEMTADYNQRTAAYEKETKSYTENNSRYRSMRANFSENCATKGFYREDMDAAILEN